jgi:hypothetical protein
MCRISQKQLNSKLGPDYTLPGRNITSRADTLKHMPDYHYPGRGKACKPTGPALLIPAGPGSLHPGWPSVPVSPAGPGQRPPGWAGIRTSRLGRSDSRLGHLASGPGLLLRVGIPPAGRDSTSGPGLLLRRAVFCAAPGWAGSGGSGLAEITFFGPPFPGRVTPIPAGPGRDSPGPGLGRITSPLAGSAPPGPRFTPSGIFSSSGIDSIALCQSWDAPRLRLAHPPDTSPTYL